MILHATFLGQTPTVWPVTPKSEWENNPVAEITLLKGPGGYVVKTSARKDYAILERWMLPSRKTIIVLK